MLLARERAAKLFRVHQQGPFHYRTFKVVGMARTGRARAETVPTPTDAFARPGLKVAIQRMREGHINRWHSFSVSTTASPHPDAYGTPDNASPEDLNAAVGAYLMAPVNPLLRRNLLNALANEAPREWPRLVGGPPADAPAGAAGPR